MRRPPKDYFNYSDHVARKDDIIKVWCVECERWSPVVVVALATVTYKQKAWPSFKTSEARDPVFYCGSRACWADVGYLLDEAHREMILKLAEVPVPRKKKALPIARKVQRVQLRMEI